MRKPILIVATLIYILCFSNAFAQNYFTDSAQSIKYQNCINQVKEDATEALSSAQKWYIDGGGVAAQHCEALALYEQENFDAAALLFDTIVDKLSTGESVSDFAFKNRDLLKIQLNYLAGIAWQSAGKLEKAYNSLSASIIGLDSSSPYAYDVFIERGLVQIERADFLSAVEDFTRALEINSERFDAFLYRAEAYRKSKQYLKSRLDLNEGLTLKPNNPDLLFESGINYRLQRNDEKAVIEWEKLIEKYPNTHWQELAEENIKLIIE